jgi:phosphoglycolate phosphatase
MDKRLVIFDCDGVLFRSEAANVAFYNEVMRILGEPAMDVRGEAASHALASAQLFESLFAGRPQLFERARSIARSLDYGPYYGLMTPQAGLYDVLATIRSRYRVAMATNRGKTATEVVRRFALDPYIELTVGVLDVPRPKPYPDMLEHCVAHFGVSTEEALYVGDQQIDADAALAAGLSFVAVGDSVNSTDHRIAELDELPHLIARL